MSSSAPTCDACGATIADAFATGTLCSACHVASQPADPRIRKVLSSLLTVGVVAAVLALVFSVRVNGIDYVRAPAGVIAIVGGIAGILAGASFGRTAGKPGHGAVGLFALVAGAWALWAAFR